MISNEEVYIGTKLKYLIEIGSAGFAMERDRFTVDILRGQNSMHFEKFDMEMDDQGNWYVCFDTLALGTGKITAKVTAYVPDTDFEGGIRTEVTKIDLINIKA